MRDLSEPEDILAKALLYFLSSDGKFSASLI